MITQEDTDKIISFVKHEPRTVQDISKLIKKSWVTTDSYLKKIKESTGLISIKTFRKGSQGALKIVYYNNQESSSGDDLKNELFAQIKAGKKKTDFEFFDLFQHIDDKKKRIFLEEYDDDSTNRQQFVSFLRKAQHSVYIFSGNLSFINMTEGKTKILDIFYELIERKISIKILCRVNFSSINNISKLTELMNKHPELIEIRNCSQPLRGFIIDDTLARFKSEEMLKDYKPGELNKNMRIFYEIYDAEWISWMQKVFWSLYRFSMEYSNRIKQLKKIKI